MINQALHFWELLWEMTEKELRARYKHTVFGFLWLVANPALQMLIIGFIFPLFFETQIEHYSFYLFTGLLAWNFFSLSLSKATPSIVFERSLVKKAMFPRAVIPLSIVMSNFINYTVALVIFLIPVLFLNTLSLKSCIFFLVGMTALVVLAAGISLLTSALNVRYRDINFFVQALLIIWFYATPIVYAPSQLPEALLWLWRFNPLTSVIQLMHHALIQAPLPDAILLSYNALIIVAVSVIGVYIFSKESKNFDDWL